MSNPNQHDIEQKPSPATGGGVPKPKDPSKIEQGSKNPDVRDKADHTEHPTPRR